MSSMFESLDSMPQPQLIPTPMQHLPVAQPQQQTEAQLMITQSETPAQSTTGTTKPSSFKNRLQEYAQKVGIPRPQYHTVNEGLLHAPMFRSTVEVGGQLYTSPNIFSHRKAAEFDVARIAIEKLSLKTREENCTLIQEDTIFCKSILNEFADKIHVCKPLYKTEKIDGLIPSFVSSLVFNGKQYVGKEGKSKKESQQLAARDIILSILDSDARAVISKIIKSKRLLYAAMYRGRNDAIHVGIQAVTNVSTYASKGKGLEIVENDNMPRTAIPEPWTKDSSNVSTKHDVEVIANSMVLVSPTSEHQIVDGTSGKKRKRKNKKVINAPQVDAQVHIAAVSSNQTSTCIAAQ